MPWKNQALHKKPHSPSLAHLHLCVGSFGIPWTRHPASLLGLGSGTPTLILSLISAPWNCQTRMLINLLNWCEPRRNAPKSPKPRRLSCLSGARQEHAEELECMCKELRRRGLIVAKNLTWEHSMFDLGAWSYRAIGENIGQQWSGLELCF